MAVSPLRCRSSLQPAAGNSWQWVHPWCVSGLRLVGLVVVILAVGYVGFVSAISWAGSRVANPAFLPLALLLPGRARYSLGPLRAECLQRRAALGVAAASCDGRLWDLALGGKRGGVLGGTEERPGEEVMATDSFFGGRVEEKLQRKPKTWVG